MMTKDELAVALTDLRLSQTEAAQLLGVSDRTLRRWFDGEVVPGPAAAALRAWQRLKSGHLAWRPDSISIVQDDQEQIALHRNHAVGLADMLGRVEARGGARTPWVVDVAKHQAKLGPIEIGFYLLQSGSFSLSTYTRRDRQPDLQGDWSLIEDAASCIARKLSQWGRCAEAIRAVGSYTREHKAVFVRTGAKMLSSDAVYARQADIEALADRFDNLADAALVGEATNEQFELIRRELQSLGFFAPNEAVGDVARAFHALHN